MQYARTTHPLAMSFSKRALTLGLASFFHFWSDFKWGAVLSKFALRVCDNGKMAPVVHLFPAVGFPAFKPEKQAWRTRSSCESWRRFSAFWWQRTSAFVLPLMHDLLAMLPHKAFVDDLLAALCRANNCHSGHLFLRHFRPHFLEKNPVSG